MGVIYLGAYKLMQIPIKNRKTNIPTQVHKNDHNSACDQ